MLKIIIKLFSSFFFYSFFFLKKIKILKKKFNKEKFLTEHFNEFLPCYDIPDNEEFEKNLTNADNEFIKRVKVFSKFQLSLFL